MHPNRTAFTGVLTIVGEASDKSPAGASGHRVLLTYEAVRDALHTLLGMGVDYRPGWDGHNARCKVGVITDAYLVGNEVRVSGHLYGRDFPEVIECLAPKADNPEMGMSYEIADARVADMRLDVWTLTRVTFTGAAILLKSKAAYKRTTFHVSTQLNPIAGTTIAARGRL